MPLTMINVTDYELWGRLVKTWATGRSYLPGGQVLPIPRNLAEFKDQVGMLGCATVPSTVTDMEIETYPSNKLHISLPSKADIDAIEAQVKAPFPYPIPSFYFTDVPHLLGMNTDQKMAFNAKRIGEYTVNYCG